MTAFKLPDLGEGLPDAEIHQWYVSEGEQVDIDQPLVAMETAKAVVDVPSPVSGKISKLHGQPGDIIKTGGILVEFEGETGQAAEETSTTVVGSIESSDKTVDASFILGSDYQATAIKTTPRLRAFAQRQGVKLSTLTTSHPDGIITLEDIQQQAPQAAPALFTHAEPLQGVRRAMASSMAKAQREVVSVSIYDDADISAWAQEEDITVRLIQALVHACQQEPALNVWYDGTSQHRQFNSQINLGLAVDTEEGLFVPVIKQVENQSPQQLRDLINHYKRSIKSREIDPKDLQGATITLSNFGKFAGRYATPIIVPPTVAILAVGSLRQEAHVANHTIAIHPILPLSLSFDHRAVTGGEASRFLHALLTNLQMGLAK